MDAIPNFALSREAIRKAATLATNVICEGILASTVFGSWATFARDLEHEGKEFAFVYLQTPVSVCLERIQARNGGKKINEKLVHDKVRAIAATREKVMSAGLRAFDLPLGFEEKALADIILGKGDAYVAE
jgi:shikimate kinase